MAQAPASAIGDGDNVEFNWEGMFQALALNWPWLNYIVVWKFDRHARALVWHRGYFDDTSSSSTLQDNRTLANSFSSVYRSCAFTSPNSGYAARAVFQQSPLWWTSNQPRLPTDERIDQFLQRLGVQTIACLPGPGTDGNMYCLELASTHLNLDSSRLLRDLQAFASGSGALPGDGSQQLFHSTENLPAGGPIYGREAGADERARVSGVERPLEPAAAALPQRLPRPATDQTRHLGSSMSFNPQAVGNRSHELQVQSLEGFEELYSGPAASSLLIPHAASWFASAEVGEFGAQVVSSLAAYTTHDQQIVAEAQDIQLESVSTASSSPAGGLTTSMMLNLWASMSDIDESPEMHNISSFMQRSTLDSLVMAHDNITYQPASTILATTTQSPAMAGSATPLDNVLPYHLAVHQSASNPYQRMESPELSASSTALVAPSSMSRQAAPGGPSTHLRQIMLAQLGGDRTPSPAAGVVDRAALEQPGNLSESGVNRDAWLQSPFKPFEPSRHSKQRRLDGSRDTGIAGPSKPRKPMIELWKDLCPRIQESDRMKRRIAAAQNEELIRSWSQVGTTVQQQFLGAGAAAAGFMQDTASDQQYYSPGWHEEQAQIAYQHKMAERDRRSKFKDKIHTLFNIVPTTKKKDNLSVLTSTIDYIRQLKEQIAGMERTGSVATAATSTHDPVRLQAPASSSGPSNSAAATAEAQAQQPSTSAAHPSSSSIKNTTTVAVRSHELPVGTEAPGTSHGGGSRSALVIEVEMAGNNLQSLIRILKMVQDLGLDMDSMSSGNLHNGRSRISLTVLVPANSSRSQQDLVRLSSEVKETLERVLALEGNHSPSTTSEMQLLAKTKST